MSEGPESETHVTLLGRLRLDPGDQGAWQEFVQHYGARISNWCRSWGLQEADAQDVTQDVLLKLSEKLKSFSYDPERSFRGWLRTLAHHAWSDFLEAQRRPGRGSGDSEVVRLLGTVEASEDLARQLEEQWDRELMQQATCRVQLRVAPKTWEAFRLTAIEGLSGQEAAEQIEMQVPQVYVAKRRVQKMLQEEMRKLDR
jgi:RNA polymerase sigma-70 factor (ECF subfamily)